MKLALLFALAACSRSSTTSAEQPPVVPPAPGDAGQQADPMAGATELVVGVVEDWTATHATLRRFRRGDPPGTWTQVGEPWPAVVGRTGLAWGAGMHGDEAPPGQSGPVKREGDGKSPAGMFRIRNSYGYADQPPAGTKLPYVVATDQLCVDDPTSSSYARIVGPGVSRVDWTSHEVMRRQDALYEWVIDVAHNATHTPGRGSCIFLHVWRSADSTTAGCTAMAEDKLRELVGTLDPSTVFVLLPQGAYGSLRAAWKLPAL